MADSQRRSTRIAAQPKKEEAPKPAVKPRKPSNKRPAADGPEAAEAGAEEKKPAAKKVCRSSCFEEVVAVRCGMATAAMLGLRDS